ncbi:MAG: glycosyltransferase family 4 protein [Candidatus Latescibacterota bacterium]|nr:glycosyltransferase family 4 protein [Candidatus Latescibacterota bacterium]
MNVAIVTPTFLPVVGGAEIVVHQEALQLLELGHQVTVFVPNRFAKANQGHAYPVVPFWRGTYSLVEYLPSWGQRVVNWQLSRYAEQGVFDVWHIHFAYPTGYAFLQCMDRWKLNGVLTCHGADLQRDPASGYGFRLDPAVDARVKQTVLGFPLVTAISESVSAEYDAIGVNSRRIRSVPNGVTLDRFSRKHDRDATRTRLGIPLGTKLILAVGRNHPKKGYRFLVEAAASLKVRTSIPFIVLFVGPGVSDLDTLSRDMGVSDCVRTLDSVVDPGNEIPTNLPPNALIETYQAADVFVLPSLIETFGMVLVEAMACGLPVITTDAPGCRDVVTHRKTGLTVKASDPDALSTAILSVLEEPDLAGRLSEAGRIEARKYDWRRVTEAYISVFSESEQNSVM